MAVIEFDLGSPETRACDHALHDERDLPATGTRIVLVAMDDDPEPLLPGERGTVTGCSYMPPGSGTHSQIWVRWDCGRGLNLIQGKDLWTVIGYDEEHLRRDSGRFIPPLVEALRKTPTGIFGVSNDFEALLREELA